MEINNNIRESLCSMKMSQELHHRGFDVICDKKWMETLDGEIVHGDDIRNCVEHDRAELYLWQPTHSMAIAWFRENFGANIYAIYDNGWIGVASNCSGNYRDLRTAPLERIEDALEDAMIGFLIIRFFGTKP